MIKYRALHNLPKTQNSGVFSQVKNDYEAKCISLNFLLLVLMQNIGRFFDFH